MDLSTISISSDEEDVHNEVPSNNMVEPWNASYARRQSEKAVEHCFKLLNSQYIEPARTIIINDLIANGTLPILVQSLTRSDNQLLQHQALHALAKIADIRDREVVEAGAITAVTSLLNSPNHYLRNMAVWLLTRLIITVGCNEPQEYVEYTVVSSLVNLFKPDMTSSILHNLVVIFGCLCKKRERHLLSSTVQKILYVFNTLFMQHIGIHILKNATRAISDLVSNGEQQIQMVVESGIVTKLIPFLYHKDERIQMNVLITVEEMTKSTNEQWTRYLVDCDVLFYFPDLLASPTLHEKVLWILSNVVAKIPRRTQTFFDVGLLPGIIMNLRAPDHESRSKATWLLMVISNDSSKDQITTLIDIGVFPPLCDLFDFGDLRLIKIVLEVICNIMYLSDRNMKRAVNVFYKCGGFSQLNMAKTSADFHVSTKAGLLLNKLMEEQIFHLGPMDQLQ